MDEAVFAESDDGATWDRVNVSAQPVRNLQKEDNSAGECGYLSMKSQHWADRRFIRCIQGRPW